MVERVVKVRLAADDSKYASSFENATDKARGLREELGKTDQKRREAFQQIGAGAVVLGGAMTALTLTVLKAGIEYNTLQQTSRAALTTLLGSAQAANDQMDRLDAFARTSPFAKTTFITAQQQMLAFGIEAKKVVPYLDAIQDAVAAAGGSNQELSEIAFIMAQISSAGKITGQDLLQFGQRGVNAAELIGSQMGKTGAQIRQEITDGTLDADAALDALAGGMKEKFDGAAANVKNTFAGAMDRVKAAWRDLSAELAAPLVDPSGGGALVDLLNWAADMMRAFQDLPEPVRLAGGALFALAGFVTLASGAALLATPRVIAMKVAFMALSTTMQGFAITGGAAVLALTAVAAVIGIVAAAQARAQQLADEYGAALRQGADAATEFVAEQLAMKDSFLWMDRGSAVENAKKLGLSLDDVTKAVTGTTAEYEAFKEKVDEAYAAAGKTLDAGYAMEQLKNKVADLRGAQELSAKQTVDTAAANESLTGSFDEATDATADLEEQTKLATDALNGTKDALDAVAGKSRDMAAAHDDALSAINGLTEAAKAEGVSFDGTNEQSIKFRDSLRDVEQAHRDSAQAIIDNGGTLSDAQTEWQKGRDTIIEMLKAKGMDNDSAVAWADQQLGSASEVKGSIEEVYRAWLNLPENKETKYKVEAAEAAAKLADLKARLDAIPNTKYTRVTLEAFRVGNFDVSPNAAGGLYANGVKKFAAGGMEPGIYPYRPGGIHKFAEEYAEGYVSMDPRRRTKSEGVWTAIGQQMGFGQSASGVSMAQLPPIYIQSPVTGEYLLARTVEIASGVVAQYDSGVSTAVHKGRRSV